MSHFPNLRQFCNLRALLVIALPILVAWSPWPVATTLLHVPLLVVCTRPVAVGLFGLQALFTGLSFLRPDLPWFPVAAVAALATVIAGRVAGQLVNGEDPTLRREGPQVRKILLLVAMLLAASTSLRAVPMGPAACWAAVYGLVGFAMPKREPMPAWKARAANLALLLVSILFSLFIGEVGARLVFGPPQFYLKMLHPDRIMTLRPNSHGSYPIRMGADKAFNVPIQISSDGLRDEPLRPKENGEVRIMCIGDSFTFGSGVHGEEAYPQQLEQVLNERAGDARFSVVNAGVGGSGTFQQLDFFLDIVEEVEPDYVVHQMLLANDIADDLLFEDKLPQSVGPWFYRQRYFLLRGPKWIIWLDQELQGRSALYSALWRAIRGDWRTLDITQHLRFLEPIEYPIPDGPGMMRPHHIETLLRDWYPELIEGWELNRKHALALRDYCAGAGIQYFAFGAPCSPEVVDGIWLDIPNAFPQLEGQMHLYDQEKNARLAREFFQDNNIPYVDMFRAFRKHPDPARLYYLFDGHWNLHGCRYAAETVANALALHWPDVFPPRPMAELPDEEPEVDAPAGGADPLAGYTESDFQAAPLP